MYAMGMAAERKAAPRDDIVTRLLEADKDGRGLNDDEFGYFVIILAVASNETTRNDVSHGMNAFLDNTNPWDHWKRQQPEPVAEQVLRWETAVYVFQRTGRGRTS